MLQSNAEYNFLTNHVKGCCDKNRTSDYDISSGSGTFSSRSTLLSTATLKQEDRVSLKNDTSTYHMKEKAHQRKGPSKLKLELLEVCKYNNLYKILI